MTRSGSETREQAAARRCWITLAEFVAVAGLLIGAATLYLNWSDRREDRVAAESTKAGEVRERERVDLSVGVENGGSGLLLKDERHEVTDISVRFPTMLGVSVRRSGARPTIEAVWIQAALLKATDGGQDDREGRLPVLITVRYLDKDTPRSATDTYDLIWETGGRMLRGRSLSLEGLRLRERGGSQATIDALARRDLAP